MQCSPRPTVCPVLSVLNCFPVGCRALASARHHCGVARWSVALKNDYAPMAFSLGVIGSLNGTAIGAAFGIASFVFWCILVDVRSRTLFMNFRTRFSLRTLAIFVTLVCAYFASWGPTKRAAELGIAPDTRSFIFELR